MRLIDTSAWIEYLRDGDRGIADRVERHLELGDAVITEPVAMEILQGARSDRHAARLQSLLARVKLEPVETNDYREAALLYRLCRTNGDTIRSSVDCLIAAVAIRAEVQVLHHDRDFDALGRWTPLRAGPGRPRGPGSERGGGTGPPG